MGLDSVELVLAIEEEFEITIDDADAANLTTSRILADYVVSRMKKIGDSERRRCLSQMGFYRIRFALVSLFGASRNDVRPDSPIQHFLKGEIKTQWRQLRDATGATNFPRLECKRQVYFTITLGVPAALASVMLWKNYQLSAVFLASLATWICSHILTDKMANMIPSNFSTVGALAPYARLTNQTDWNRDMVLQRVIQITSAQLGIPVEEIHPDHHFVKDLGLDA